MDFKGIFENEKSLNYNEPKQLMQTSTCVKTTDCYRLHNCFVILNFSTAT